MDLYREGFLNKAGKGVLQTHLQSWRPRYFVLNGSCLKYYKSKEIEPENMLGCIEIIDIACVSLMKNEKYSFQITTKSPKSRTYYMSGKSDDEVMGWIHVIDMAKAKMEKQDAGNTSHAELDLYDEVKPPSKSIIPKSPVRSVYCMLGGGEDMTQSSSPPSSPASTDQAKPPANSIRSKYDIPISVGNSPRTTTKNESVSEDLTYDNPDKVSTSQSELPKQTSVKKIESGEMTYAADSTECLMEDLTYDKPDKKESPKRTNVKKDENFYEDPNAGGRDNADLYDSVLDVDGGKASVVEPPPLPMRPSSLSDIDMTGEMTIALGLYAEIGGECSKGNVEEAKKKSEGVKGDGAEETKTKTLPVYAKPMRKKSSKRVLNPAMMDIGEVSIDVETESSGGRETLKRGMTQPIGDRFAFEELKELLSKFDEEDHNNKTSGQSEAKMADFDIDQGGLSAFDVLKRFLEKNQ